MIRYTMSIPCGHPVVMIRAITMSTKLGSGASAQLVARHRQHCDFAAVYIQEAHAVDEWPISEAPRTFRQHRELADRVAAARAFVADYPQPEGLVWFVDDMANSFNRTYASWPFRFWVLCPPPPPLPGEGGSGTAAGAGGIAPAPAAAPGAPDGWWVGFKPMPRDATYDLGELDSFLLSVSNGGV